MARRDVTMTMPDGVCPASLHAPDRDGRWPGVIMFSDAGGVRETFRAMAERLASLGYAVLLPDLYYRVGPIAPFDMATAFFDADERARLLGLAASVTKDAAAGDTGVFLDFLSAQPEVGDGKVGVVGYCLGGGLALVAAGRFPGRVGAAASFHGGHIASTASDSPHLLAPSMTATVYVAAAENDPTFDEAQHDRLSAALATAGVDHTLVTYPAPHGFAVPDTPAYDPEAAARHWDALASLYGRSLTSG